MDPKKLEVLFVLLGHDLAGWQLAKCYFLRLRSSQGDFLAVTTDDERPVLVLDEMSLVDVAVHLPERSYTMNSIFTLVYVESGVAFNIHGGSDRLHVRPLRVLFGEAIKERCQKECPFRWASNNRELY